MASKTFDQYLSESGRQSELDALRFKTDGSYERAKAQYEGGGSYGSGDPAKDFINSILDDLTRPLKEATQRAGEFDKNNPFAFDEVLARDSANERLSPFYESELRDFMTGVTRARGRTIQDEEKFRQELDTTTENTSARIRRNIDETIKSSEEGYAGSGLLASGARERTTGIQGIEGGENLNDFMRKQTAARNEAATNKSRALEDLATREATGIRQSKAAQETALTTDVEEQRREANQKREYERQQYIGYPLASGTGSLSSIFGIS